MVKAVVVFVVSILQSDRIRNMLAARAAAPRRRRDEPLDRGCAAFHASGSTPATCPLAVTHRASSLLMFGGRLVRVRGSFFSPQVFLNLFIDNAFLLIVAIGMTFVILSGGIDLSVGSVIALTTMVSAALLEHHGWSPARGHPAGARHGRGLRLRPGAPDPVLRDPALHRHAGGHVPGARPLLPHQHRLHLHHQPVLRRGGPGAHPAARSRPRSP